eukprot:scaffold1197_cov228-Pinguiococcus_pyrenoidosus.AAC.13
MAQTAEFYQHRSDRREFFRSLLLVILRNFALNCAAPLAITSQSPLSPPADASQSMRLQDVARNAVESSPLRETLQCSV